MLLNLGPQGKSSAVAQYTHHNRPQMLIKVNADSEELRNFRLLQRRFIVFNPSKAAYIDSAAEGLLALASQGHSSADEGHSSADEGHSSADEGHFLADEGHSLADEGHSSGDEGHSSADEGQSLADEGYSSGDEGQLQAPNGQYPAGPASPAATQSSHPGRQPMLTQSASKCSQPCLLPGFFSCSSAFSDPTSFLLPWFCVHLLLFLMPSGSFLAVDLPFLPLPPFCPVNFSSSALHDFSSSSSSALFCCSSSAAVAAVSLLSIWLSFSFSANFLLLIHIFGQLVSLYLLAC